MAVTPVGVAASRLPAHPDPHLDTVLGGGLPHELSYALGGPFHLLLPERFDANAAAFERVLREAGVEGRVYYAKKANKAAVWMDRCALSGRGVDVASSGELRDALGHGVRGEDVVVTGPAKAEGLLRVAVLHGCLIAVDALDELESVLAQARALARPARVLLRRLPPAQQHSRFGLDDGQLDAALARCAQAPDAIVMEGFSFHLSGYDPLPRAELAGELIELCLKARTTGLRADRISIGGGFAVDYTDTEHWQRFLREQRPEHYHAGKSFHPGDFYPYHSPVAGPDALRAVLTTDALAQRLREAGVRLLLEPGRALLDRAGCTVFRVQGVKDRDGYGIVTVDGSSLSLSEQWFNSEYLPDPVLLPEREPHGGPYAACVGGATCLESDMVTWRKVRFPRRPAVGDLLVYPNTAGYQMDSNESPFHELPLPPKVVLDTVGGTTRWRLDRHPLA
ncbi:MULTISPECIES: Y4yA family PLP-dependent enzyme [unclassified Streptomyces]|uniref:Y4yA family PLP-dependent enzyme n=1 Tax=unclassified Streptomyces TaxID=2593676 RepID=UPI0036EA3F18